MNISLGCSDLILIGYIHSSTKSRKEDGLEDILKFLNVSDAHEEEVGSRWRGSGPCFFYMQPHWVWPLTTCLLVLGNGTGSLTPTVAKLPPSSTQINRAAVVSYSTNSRKPRRFWQIGLANGLRLRGHSLNSSFVVAQGALPFGTSGCPDFCILLLWEKLWTDSLRSGTWPPWPIQPVVTSVLFRSHAATSCLYLGVWQTQVGWISMVVVRIWVEVRREKKWLFGAYSAGPKLT